MEDSQAPDPRGETRRTPPNSRNTRASERNLLRAQGRVCLEATSPRLLALADRLPLLQGLAHRWDLGADTHHPAREATLPDGPKSHSECSDHRLPDDQDHREGRTARLRRGQEDER